MSRDREDLTAQREAVAHARTVLENALAELSATARAESKVAGRAKGNPNLEAVAADYNAVQRAGEALDMAVYDLHTASGEDG